MTEALWEYGQLLSFLPVPDQEAVMGHIYSYSKYV